MDKDQPTALQPPSLPGVALRVFIFALMEVLGMVLFAFLFMPFGMLIASTLSTFGAASVANTIALRVYERGSLADIGLHWSPMSRLNLQFGFLTGLLAACAVTVLPIVLRLADFDKIKGGSFQPGSLIFVSVVLLFGAIGEEMLFRGYGFQIILAIFGPFATILPISLLFALAHSNNQNASTLGLVNTFGWGVLLGYAFLRSGDLWLPIGLHYGWNFTLPLFGVNLSGFTMGVTGYAIQWKVSDLWSGGAYGPEAGLLTTLVIPAVFYVLWKAPVRSQMPYLLRYGRA